MTQKCHNLFITVPRVQGTLVDKNNGLKYNGVWWLELIQIMSSWVSCINRFLFF